MLERRDSGVKALLSLEQFAVTTATAGDTGSKSPRGSPPLQEALDRSGDRQG